MKICFSKFIQELLYYFTVKITALHRKRFLGDLEMGADKNLKYLNECPTNDPFNLCCILYLPCRP